MDSEIRITLQTNNCDCESTEEKHYIAVVMTYDDKAYPPTWFNSGIVEHGKTPEDAFTEALRRFRCLK